MAEKRIVVGCAPMHLDSIEKPFLGELRQKLRCDVPLALRDSTCHRNHLLQIEKNPFTAPRNREGIIGTKLGHGLKWIAVISIAVIPIVVGIVAFSSYVAGTYLKKSLAEFPSLV